eukprot:scaffold22545_cov126-Isochrysis_galbana.AAC.9
MSRTACGDHAPRCELVRSAVAWPLSGLYPNTLPALALAYASLCSLPAAQWALFPGPFLRKSFRRYLTSHVSGRVHQTIAEAPARQCPECSRGRRWAIISVDVHFKRRQAPLPSDR